MTGIGKKEQALFKAVQGSAKQLVDSSYDIIVSLTTKTV